MWVDVFTHRALWCSGVDLAACVKSAGWLLSFTVLCLMVLAVSAQASWCLAGKRGGQSWHWGNTQEKNAILAVCCVPDSQADWVGVRGRPFNLLWFSLLFQIHHNNNISYWSLSQLQKKTFMTVLTKSRSDIIYFWIVIFRWDTVVTPVLF